MANNQKVIDYDRIGIVQKINEKEKQISLDGSSYFLCSLYDVTYSNFIH
ncbi:hypothetical protein SAMN05877842_103169 [Ureibacillus acetophenoni]|uniref:Uncharacterized protein n=1 Tax=Ureibacillus acetophenoni TaxID=614649 RepID=A0A285U606_9BACL|nr:hypothetical protein SAMN05877842_103169 [Ureibacillus acetophenoni]